MSPFPLKRDLVCKLFKEASIILWENVEVAGYLWDIYLSSYDCILIEECVFHGKVLAYF